MYIINKYKNRFIVGSVQFGLKYGATNKFNEISGKNVKKILLDCYKNNIKEIDTAFDYGNSHKKIISFLKKEKNKKFIVTTKITLKTLKSMTFKEIENKIKLFKSNLSNTHEINLLCHDQKILEKKNSNVLKNFIKIKKKNIIKKIGVSVYDKRYILQGLKNINLDIVEAPGSILDQTIISHDFLKYKKEIKKKLYLRSIFLQGLLLTNQNKLKNKLFKSKIKIIDQFSNEIKISKLELCVNFVFQIFDPKKVIFGVANNSQLKKFLKVRYIKLNKNFDFKKFGISSKKIIDPRKW